MFWAIVSSDSSNQNFRPESRPTNFTLLQQQEVLTEYSTVVSEAVPRKFGAQTVKILVILTPTGYLFKTSDFAYIHLKYIL